MYAKVEVTLMISTKLCWT